MIKEEIHGTKKVFSQYCFHHPLNLVWRILTNSTLISFLQPNLQNFTGTIFQKPKSKALFRTRRLTGLFPPSAGFGLTLNQNSEVYGLAVDAQIPFIVSFAEFDNLELVWVELMQKGNGNAHNSIVI